MNRELPDVQAGFRKGRETRDQMPTYVGSSKKYGSSRKTSTSALLTTPKPLTVWITINCGKFWKRWEYQTTSSASWETCMQVKKQQLKKTYRWLTNTWKDAQHHSLSEKCKWKPQWGTISRQSEWLQSKSLQAINDGEGVEKRNPLTLLVGMQTSTATMENSVEIP